MCKNTDLYKKNVKKKTINWRNKFVYILEFELIRMQSNGIIMSVYLIL